MKPLYSVGAARGFLDRHGDGLLVAALLLVTQVEAWTIRGSYLQVSRLPIAVTTLVMTLALLLRRRAPLLMVALISGAVVVQLVLARTPHPTSAPLLVWMVAAYSLGVHARRRHARIGIALLVGSIDVWAVADGGGSSWVFLTVILAGFWIVGRVVRSRHQLAVALEARTRELEREREKRDRLLVAEERTRIARELHDVVAHTLGVVVMRAGAERLHLSPGSPQYDAFSSIEVTGREALEEMGLLLGMLRSADSPGARAPQPGLGRLDALLDSIRETGTEVELVVNGEPRTLSPALDVSAYRIVQEALTNTVRHSGSDRARIGLSWHPTELEIEVADGGVGGDALSSPAGHGLLGIRERVALFGGTLVTGHSDLGGFLVRASLPAPSE
jgi:signal transduction histidine kinase